MSLSVWAGFGLIAVGAGALGYALLAPRRATPVSTPYVAPVEPERPTDVLHPHADREEALEVIERQQMVRLLGETEERQVLGTITLTAMTKTDGRWHEKRDSTAFRALNLAGGIWIFKVPSREGGESIWVKAELVDSPYRLMDFFKGDNDQPGPARQFKINDQTVPVPFALPDDFGDSTQYEVTDIGRFGTDVDGEEDIFQSGDFYPFVTAHAADASRVMIYLDPRDELAGGTGGLFVGEVFEPDVDIASLL